MEALFVSSSLTEGIGACVEVAVNGTVSPCGILVCDSKDRSKPPLHHHTNLWKLFIGDIKAGRYDYGRLTSTPLTTDHPEHGTISVVLEGRKVRMTHSQQPDHEGHLYTPREWRAFVGYDNGPDDKRGAKGGEFDLVEQGGQYHVRRKLALAAAPTA